MTTTSGSRRAIVLLSGGIDSTACLHFYRDLSYQITALFVDVGQSSHLQDESGASAVASRLLSIARQDRHLAGLAAVTGCQTAQQLCSEISGIWRCASRCGQHPVAICDGLADVCAGIRLDAELGRLNGHLTL